MNVQSKAWVCDHLLADIVGSNPAGAWMTLCCECCEVEVSGGLLPSILCLIECSRSLDDEEALAC